MQKEKITLYTIHCAQCKVLEKKLDSKGIKYDVVEDREVMKQKGFMSMPILEVDGKKLVFAEAVKFCNNYTGGEA